MSSEYHKIQSVYKRDLEGVHGRKGAIIPGAFSTPELECLQGLEWEFQEKLDGTNIRIIVPPSLMDGDGAVVEVPESIEIRGKTDRAHFDPAVWEEACAPFIAARSYELCSHFEYGAVLYGELIGPKVQKGGGRYGAQHSIVLFDAYVTSESGAHWWLLPDIVEGVALSCGLRFAPTIGRGTLREMEATCRWGFKSEWGDFAAEGIVARPPVQLFDRKGQRIITKLKHKDFNL